MKNIFNEADKSEILQRIDRLTPNSKALWGKMDVAQMLAHCALGTNMLAGEVTPRRAPFPLNILGRFIKKLALGEGPMRKNSPTAKETRIVEPMDFDKEKANFMDAINKLYQGGHKGVKVEVHFFFGRMTPMEWGRLNYKHADHHLSQFGV